MELEYALGIGFGPQRLLQVDRGRQIVKIQLQAFELVIGNIDPWTVARTHSKPHIPVFEPSDLLGQFGLFIFAPVSKRVEQWHENAPYSDSLTIGTLGLQGQLGQKSNWTSASASNARRITNYFHSLFLRALNHKLCI